jgi:hypothetical protein
MRRVLCNLCCSGKVVSITYSECVFVGLGIQHALRMRLIILSPVACLALPYFSTLSHRGHDFRKKNSLNIKCVFCFSLQPLSEKSLILRIIERDIVNVYWVSCPVPVILSDFNENLISKTDLRKILKYQNSWKSIHWEPSCSMRTEGRIDKTKLIVASPNFANAPKNF